MEDLEKRILLETKIGGGPPINLTLPGQVPTIKVNNFFGHLEDRDSSWTGFPTTRLPSPFP